MRTLILAVSVLALWGCNQNGGVSATQTGETPRATEAIPSTPVTLGEDDPLVVLATTLAKSEFESTADYRARIEPAITKAYITRNRLAWSVFAKYDAEAKQIVLEIPGKIVGSRYSIDRVTEEQTRMGVTFKVTHGDRTYVRAVPDNAFMVTDRVARIPLPPEEAKAATNDLEVAYVFTPLAWNEWTYVKTESSYASTSLDDPWDGETVEHSVRVHLAELRVRRVSTGTELWRFTDAQAQAEQEVILQRQALAAAGIAETELREAAAASARSLIERPGWDAAREDMKSNGAEFLRKCRACARAIICEAELRRIMQTGEPGRPICTRR
jgi:hypothetical protein